MKIIDVEAIEFPVFEYSKRGNYFHSIERSQFGYATGKGIKNLENEDLSLLDSQGRQIQLNRFSKGKVLKPKISEIVLFDFRYHLEMELLVLQQLDLESFKKEILEIISSNRYSLESSGNPNEIIADVKKANSYRKIIEMFL